MENALVAGTADLLKKHLTPSQGIAALDIATAVKNWINPLSCGQNTLRQIAATLKPIGMAQSDVPLILQLVENPKFAAINHGLFPGATSLQQHDYIHMVLGRGMLPKDEAFVIGFTMGTTKKFPVWKRSLFTFITQYLYPKNYRFSAEEAQVFLLAAELGSSMKCASLATVNFEVMLDLPVAEIRKLLDIDEAALAEAYAVEQQLFPLAFESSRLLL